MKFGPTKSPETAAAYNKRFRQFQEHIQAEIGGPADVVAVVRWFADGAVKSDWRHSTFRQYKAAIGYVCNQQAPGSPAAAEAYEQLMAVEYVSHAKRAQIRDCEEQPKLPERTSSAKQKSFPPSDLAAMCRFLLTRRWKFGELAASWLNVGIIAGLRPEEHYSARILRWGDAAPYKLILLIKNAKNSNGRAHGHSRRLILDKLPAADLEMLQRHLDRLNKLIDDIARANNCGRRETFHCIQRRVGRAVGCAGRLIWPRRKLRPVLYSTRHQFIADCKAMGMSREVIAAMVGHATKDTAGKHYARAGSGRNVVFVEAHPEEVLLIRPGQARGGPARKRTSGVKPIL